MRALFDFLFQKLVLVAQEVVHTFGCQLAFDAGLHDGRADWLGDVIDRAHFQPLGFVVHFVHGGDENHRNVARHRIGFQGHADFVAAHAGHHDVEQDQVDPGFGKGDFQRAFTIDGNLGDEVL